MTILRTDCHPVNDRPLMFSDDRPNLDRHGYIGHVRMDFDRSGKGFFTTWWPGIEELNTATFKEDLQEVVNTLRERKTAFDGIEGTWMPLASRKALRDFCSALEPIGESEDWSYTYRHGIRLDTEKYVYLLRFCPMKGMYDCYCYCYLKEQYEREEEAK